MRARFYFVLGEDDGLDLRTQFMGGFEGMQAWGIATLIDVPQAHYFARKEMQRAFGGVVACDLKTRLELPNDDHESYVATMRECDLEDLIRE